MCKHCEGTKPIKYDSGSLGRDPSNPPYLEVYMDGDEPGLHFVKNGSGTWFPASHCPACGQPLTEPKALTLEELRERDGRPVWLVDNGRGRWAICTGYEWRQGHVTEWIGFQGHGVYPFEDYAKYWLAYDHQPKEGPRRENTRKTCATCKSLYVKDFAVGVCEHPGSGKTTVQPKDGCEFWEERLWR